MSRMAAAIDRVEHLILPDGALSVCVKYVRRFWGAAELAARHHLLARGSNLFFNSRRQSTREHLGHKASKNPAGSPWPSQFS
jgi:hypothetical protein